MNNPDASTSTLSAIKKLRVLFGRGDKIQWLIILGLLITASLLEISTALIIITFTRILIEPALAGEYLARFGLEISFSSQQLIFYLALMLGVIYLIKNMVITAEIFFRHFYVESTGYRFRSKMLERYIDMDYGLYLSRNAAFASQVIAGVTHVLFAVAFGLAILSEVFVFLALIGTLIYVNPNLALVLLPLSGVVFFLTSKILLPLFYHWGEEMKEANIQMAKNNLQFFHAFKEIIILGKQPYFVATNREHFQNYGRANALAQSFLRVPRTFLEVVFVALFVFAIFFLIRDQHDGQNIIGVLSVYLYAGFRIIPGLSQIITGMNNFKQRIPYINLVHDEYVKATTKNLYHDKPDFRFNESVTFKNVFFRHLKTEKDILSDISFSLQKGETIGIVGPTGAGKSTVMDLLLGLLRPTAGEVLIDGTFPANIRQWHSLIGYVPQAICLVDDTVEANIAFGVKDVDGKALARAIDAAQLGDFIKRLPAGVQSVIGERGIRISGGERQRIAVARALYHEPEVLIFDEATSALDNKTEKKLIETIASVSRAHTVVMVAHRLTTLKNCGRIIHMQEGRITKITSYDEMMQDSDSNP